MHILKTKPYILGNEDWKIATKSADWGFSIHKHIKIVTQIHNWKNIT